MKWTNTYDLPEPLASAIRNDQYQKRGDISATGLNKSPRQRILEARHDDKVVVDVSSEVYRLLGQSVHAVLDRADTTDHLPEEGLMRECLGWQVSGRADLLGPIPGKPGKLKISDYKVTSVFSFLLGDKPEWEAQLNTYDWLFEPLGFDIEELEIVAILRDWKSSEARRDPDYPPVGVMRLEIPRWGYKKGQAYVEERVRLHQAAEKVADEALPLCTPQERWQKPDSWAVKKLANARAYRVFDNSAAARDLAEKMKMKVEFRPGEPIRCLRYCHAAPFCSQFAAMNAAQEAAE